MSVGMAGRVPTVASAHRATRKALVTSVEVVGPAKGARCVHPITSLRAKIYVNGVRMAGVDQTAIFAPAIGRARAAMNAPMVGVVSRVIRVLQIGSGTNVISAPMN